MKAIQDWLGHSTFNVTANYYSHLDYKSRISSAKVISNALGDEEDENEGEKKTQALCKDLRSSLRAGGGGRTRTVSLPTDFESVTSANSITPAALLLYHRSVGLSSGNSGS